MLNKLALAFAVLIVVALALVAVIAISSNGDDVAEPTDSELSSSAEPDVDRTTLITGAGDRPLAVSCDVPPDENTPLLVSFVNDTGVTADYVAKVTVVYTSRRTDTAIAEATGLRAGERRSVVPEPWPDDGPILSCRLDAIQQGEHLILLNSDS